MNESEHDRQLKIFNERMGSPDKVIKARSLVKSEGDNGDDVYWFLTEDDKVVMIDMRS